MSPRISSLYRQLTAAATQWADQITATLTATRDKRRAELEAVCVQPKQTRLSEELKQIAAVTVPMAHALADMFGKMDATAAFSARAIASAMVLNIMLGLLMFAAIALLSHQGHIGQRPPWFEFHWLTAGSALLALAIGRASHLTGWATAILMLVALLGSGVVAELLRRDAVSRFNVAAYPGCVERLAAAEAELAVWKSTGREDFLRRREREILRCLHGPRDNGVAEQVGAQTGKVDSSIRVMDKAGGCDG